MNSYPYLTTILVIVVMAAFIAAWLWTPLRSIFSKSAPPLIDDNGEDIKERLERALSQQNDASVELQEVVRAVLRENDRLRRHRRNPTNA